MNTINVIGGKCYDNGNAILVCKKNRMIVIEFDSDYSITKKINAKNFDKAAQKIVESIPEMVHPSWLKDNGWNVPNECVKLANKVKD